MTSSRLLAALALLSACAHATLPGTQVPATDVNREIYAVIAKANEYLVNRDTEGLLTLVSPRYFEDNGTVQTDDDYGYHELKQRVLPESMALVKEMHLSMELHDIVVQGERAHADVRYHSRARLELPSGSVWDSHKEFNRIELEREGGRWLIVSGL